MKKTLVLLLLVCLMEFTGVSDVLAQGVGYGIFQKMHYAGRTISPTKNIDSPYLAGAEFVFCWSELEPNNGEFHWDLIDSVIAPWIAKGKKVILTFQTMQNSTFHSSATPLWVFAQGAKNFTIKGNTYPIYWDPVYLTNYQSFVRQVANRYDNNPNIEFINMGIGTGGTTNIAGNAALLNAFKKYGYTEQLWSYTILDIIDIYRNQFSSLPVVLTISPFYHYTGNGAGDGSEYLIKPIVEYAMEKGVYIYNHSLTGTTDFANNPFVPWYNTLSSQYPLSKIILGPDNPTVNTYKYGKIEDIVANAFGGLMIGNTYVPPTHIAYFIIYPQDISATTKDNPLLYDPDYAAAMQQLMNGLNP